MERWALISGLHGDLDLYEQIQRDLSTQRGIESLFVLGDLISSERNCDALLSRLRKPKRNDLKPDCIYGWWEEQLLAECGYRGERNAEVLRLERGEDAIQALLTAVGPGHAEWLASLQFGFIELDCALMHGSSADVGDQLTPTRSPLILLDRLTRLNVNRLFTARCGEQFRIELTGGSMASRVQDLSGEHQQEHTVPKRSVIGIGKGASYTIYTPANDHLEFRTIGERNTATHARGQGFA